MYVDLGEVLLLYYANARFSFCDGSLFLLFEIYYALAELFTACSALLCACIQSGKIGLHADYIAVEFASLVFVFLQRWLERQANMSRKVDSRNQQEREKLLQILYKVPYIQLSGFQFLLLPSSLQPSFVLLTLHNDLLAFSVDSRCHSLRLQGIQDTKNIDTPPTFQFDAAFYL